MLEGRWGFDATYSYSTDMLTQEMFVVIVQETVISCVSSVVAVFLVTLIITGSLSLTAMVSFSILLVDLFVLALIPLWDLTFNNILVVHLIAGLGLSVLFSLHIAHTFLLVEPPAELPRKKQRIWKARVSLSRIGSSVLHGGVSTFLAVIIVGFVRQSYFFVVFFKLWFGIVVFGMANAFILLPIVLSFVGPTADPAEKTEERKKLFFRRMSSLSKSQIEAMHYQYNFKKSNKDGDVKTQQLEMVRDASQRDLEVIEEEKEEIS